MPGLELAAQAATAFAAAAAVTAHISYRRLAAERQRCLNSFARLGVLLKRLCDGLGSLAPPEPEPEGPSLPGAAPPAEAGTAFLAGPEFLPGEGALAALAAAASAADAAPPPQRGNPEFLRARLAASAVLTGAEGAHPTGKTVESIARAIDALDRAAAGLPPPEGKAAEELLELRARAARARETFNGSAASYNRVRRAFPFVMFTRLFGFRKAYLYPAGEETADREVRL
ncbi:MAG: hypothetical protein LBW85_09965 [Deltaproteobacteria bacterium]|jgi:hypothetical protein|nr:hypothetical protein [Deltaproteobacteria bacterium]